MTHEKCCWRVGRGSGIGSSSSSSRRRGSASACSSFSLSTPLIASELLLLVLIVTAALELGRAAAAADGNSIGHTQYGSELSGVMRVGAEAGRARDRESEAYGMRSGRAGGGGGESGGRAVQEWNGAEEKELGWQLSEATVGWGDGNSHGAALDSSSHAAADEDADVDADVESAVDAVAGAGHLSMRRSLQAAGNNWTPAVVIRINCGAVANVTDNSRRVWSRDRFFEGGQAGGATLGAVAAYTARNGDHLKLLSNWRSWGGVGGRYKIPLPASGGGGLYWVRLYLSGPILLGEESSVSIEINNWPVVANTNITSNQDFAFYEFLVPVTGSSIDIDFNAALSSQPHVAAIEVMSAPPTMNALNLIDPLILHSTYRFSCGASKSFLDSNGRVWTPDSADYYPFSNSSARFSSQAVQGTGGPQFVPGEVFRSWRESNNSEAGLLFVLPTRSREFHLVRLFFAETQDVAPKDRILDIFVNGQRARTIDVSSAFGKRKGGVLEFHYMPSVDAVTGSGTISVQIQANPVSKNKVAFLNAWEVMDRIPLQRPQTKSPDGTIRINCGGPSVTDPMGNAWLADQFFKGGTARPASPPTQRSMHTRGLLEPTLYGSSRQFGPPSSIDAVAYEIPLPAASGTYWITLVFTEVDFSDPSDRSFSVIINDTPVAQGFSPSTRYGPYGFDISLDLTSPLRLQLPGGANGSYISAIKITPAPPQQYRAIIPGRPLFAVKARYNFGGSTLRDGLGRVWVGDDSSLYKSSNYSAVLTPRVSIKSTDITPPGSPIRDLLPPGLFKTSIANQVGGSVEPLMLPLFVAPFPAVNLIRLHFAEALFSAAGDRVMDIYIDNKLMWSGVDIIQLVGKDSALYLETLYTAPNKEGTGLAQLMLMANPKGKFPIPFINAAEVLYVGSQNAYAAPATGTLRLNCGGNTTSHANRTFLADKFFDGGEAISEPPSSAALLLPQGFSNPAFFSRRQWAGANGSYSVPVTRGTYLVRTTFFKINEAMDNIEFSIRINNQPVSIMQTNDSLVADSREFLVAADGNRLTISFLRIRDKIDPFVTFIEIVPIPYKEYFAALPTNRAFMQSILRSNVGDFTTSDSLSRVWYADNSTGFLFPTEAEAVTTPLKVEPQYSQVLFQTARRGTTNATWNEPVVVKEVKLEATPNYFLLCLYFADTVFKDVGDRVQDLLLNGEIAIVGLDVVAEVGPKAGLQLKLLLQNDQDTGSVVFGLLADPSSRIKAPFLSAWELLQVFYLPYALPPSSTISSNTEINCGGSKYVSSLGIEYAADEFFEGGKSAQATAADFPNFFATSFDWDLHSTYRIWETETKGVYRIPVKSKGLHMISLWFANFVTAGQLASPFSILINNMTVINANQLSFPVAAYVYVSHLAFEVSSDQIEISFVSFSSPPFINAISAVKLESNPYASAASSDAFLQFRERLNLGGFTFVDSLNRQWTIELPSVIANVSKTASFSTDKPIKGTSPDLPEEVFQTERRVLLGSVLTALDLNQTVPSLLVTMNSVGDCMLLVRLFFAELEYTKPGDRILDVFVNERLVLQGLDVVAEVGPLTALVKEFVISASAEQQAVTVEVRPNKRSKHQEAKLNAIETARIGSLRQMPKDREMFNVSLTSRINCGGMAFTDAYGREWGEDRFFEAGEAVQPTDAAIKGLAATGTDNLEFFATYRRWPEGVNNTYSIPLPSYPQIYWIRLFFAEVEFDDPKKRSFSVYIDGTPMLQDFSLESSFQGIFYEVSVPLSGPNLTITFERAKADSQAPPPTIAGIEVLPATPGQYNQTVDSKDMLILNARINTGGQSFFDMSGCLWEEDSADDFTNPLTSISSSPLNISGTMLSPQYLPPQVYQSDRRLKAADLTDEGLTFRYSVFAGSMVSVRLHFAELEYSRVGDRVMDVFINAQPVLSAFDIVAVVGPNASYFHDFQTKLDPNNFNIYVTIKPSNGSRVQEPKLNGVEVFTLIPAPLPPPPPSPPSAVAPSSSSSSGLSTAAIAGIIVGSALLLLLLLLLLILFLRKKQKEKYEKGITPFYKVAGPGGQQLIQMLQDRAVRAISLKELEEATDKFSNEMKIGAGGYGTVYKGVVGGEVKWAVKRANKGVQQDVDLFADEVDLISQLNHVNLVRLLGFCTEKNEQILVYEFIANGSLYRFLHPKHPDTPILNLQQRMEIALGVARGLDYLHSFAKEPIIHRDVKSENVLLQENLVAKVADFGLLKRIEGEGERQATRKIAGTRGYLDPEYITSSAVTTKSDVYSYGVLLLEIISGKQPIIVDREDAENTKSLVSWVKAELKGGYWQSVIDPRLNADVNDERIMSFIREIVRTALSCVQQYGHDRPPMAAVVARLEELMAGYGFEGKPSLNSNLYEDQRSESDYESQSHSSNRYGEPPFLPPSSSSHAAGPSLEQQLSRRNPSGR